MTIQTLGVLPVQSLPLAPTDLIPISRDGTNLNQTAISSLKIGIGLGNVDNTSDVAKPVSTQTQLALNAKQDTLVAGTNITITGTTISAIGGGGGTVTKFITVTSETTSKTLSNLDSGNILDSGVVTFTIPTGLTAGFNATILPPNTGVVTIVPATGVLLNGNASTITRSSSNTAVSIIPTATANSYKVTGI